MSTFKSKLKHANVKFVLRGAWLSTFSRDAMRILCLSLAGRWCRAELETGELKIKPYKVRKPSFENNFEILL